MSLLVVSSERFADHKTPSGHPEREERAQVMHAVASSWRKRGGSGAPPRPATTKDLIRVHSAAYLAQIDQTAGRVVALDPDTFCSPDSRDVALLAAGAAIVAVESVLSAEGRRGFALVRPPGHHAEFDRAMGFCLFNNVAVAAAWALDRGLTRIAVVDNDVHHGNGTQWMFYDDPRVLYVSTHQYPHYPGTGAATDVGRDRGAGFTVNLPLEAGATDGDYARVFAEVVYPLLDQFAPEMVMLSAGFDAHARDPLANMRLTAGGYASLNRGLCGIADRHCRGRLAAVTEGGYDLQAFEECLEATLRALSEPGDVNAPSAAADGATHRSAATLAAARAAHSRYWQL